MPQKDIVALSLAFSRALSLVLSLSRALISCARTHARAPSHTTGHAALAPPTKIFALPFSLSLSLSLALSRTRTLSLAREHARVFFLTSNYWARSTGTSDKGVSSMLHYNVSITHS